ncbi:MAG: hypothetical protein DRP46_05110 [Candidatus Zixiibacteriota bacterium]|nr:MAG: hypothetical protein DRP46_05110 [candidate division Zixibacteria bacterium]
MLRFAGRSDNGYHFVHSKFLAGAFILRYLHFNGPAPYPITVADLDGDGKINVLDIAYLIKYLYLDGSAPNCP